jgi:NADPH-dependent 2,4-dienoyl-CoA reductase/sulfur reductase-like enzyme
MGTRGTFFLAAAWALPVSDREMIRRDYLIVGAGVAGLGACEGIREHDKKGSIMLVGNETLLPYHRPLLLKSHLSKNGPPAPEKLLARDAAWFAKQKIDVRLDTLVTQLNLERHLVVLGNGQAVEFRKACVATGSRARRLPMAGANLGNVFYLRSLRDLGALREVVELEHNVVVIGGGLLAAEAAALLSQIPKTHVLLMHRGPHLWGRTVEPETAEWLTGYFAKHGVKLLMGETINGFEGRTVLRNVQTKSGQRFPAGVAVAALGAEMNNALFLNTPLNYPNGTPVNDYLETDEKGIYAAGDIALYPDHLFGGQRRVDHHDAALAQGRIAGANMTGKKRIKWEWMPHYASQVFDLHFDFVGDFSRQVTRVEIEGDRAKKKFLVRQYHLSALMGVVLCNQTPEKVEAAKTQVREWKREIKKHEPI